METVAVAAVTVTADPTVRVYVVRAEGEEVSQYSG